MSHSTFCCIKLMYHSVVASRRDVGEYSDFCANSRTVEMDFGLYPRLWCEQAAITRGLLPIACEWWWQLRDGPGDWEEVRVVPFFEENSWRNYGLISPTSVHRKILVRILTKAVPSPTSRHLKGKNITGNSQHGFIKGKLYLSKPTAFSDEMSRTRWEERNKCSPWY